MKNCYKVAWFAMVCSLFACSAPVGPAHLHTPLRRVPAASELFEVPVSNPPASGVLTAFMLQAPRNDEPVPANRRGTADSAAPSVAVDYSNEVPVAPLASSPLKKEDLQLTSATEFSDRSADAVRDSEYGDPVASLAAGLSTMSDSVEGICDVGRSIEKISKELEGLSELIRLGAGLLEALVFLNELPDLTRGGSGSTRD